MVEAGPELRDFSRNPIVFWEQAKVETAEQ